MKKILFIMMMLMALNASAAFGLLKNSFASGDFEYNILSEDYLTAEVKKYIGEGSDVVIPTEVENQENGKIYRVLQMTDKAFSDCKTVKSVVIPEGFNSIPNNAFAGCSLEEIVIPNSVVKIQPNAFLNCTSLKSVTLPEEITWIDERVFAGCSSLESVVMPQGICSIKQQAFQGCTSLKTIEIPNAVTVIGKYAFQNTGLTSVDVPESVTAIGDYAFSDCVHLQSAALPNSILELGDYMFKGCSALVSVNIPESISNLGKEFFAGCTTMKSFHIPATIDTIDVDAFLSCTSLTEFSVDDNHEIYSVEEGLLLSKDGSVLLRVPNGRFGEFTFPISVNIIADYAFKGCEQLTSINFSKQIVEIGDCAFWGCTSLENIKLPENLIRLNEDTFMNCTSLVSVEIPTRLSNLGDNTFATCKNLTTLYMRSSNPPMVSGETLNNFRPLQLKYMYIPTGTLQYYKPSYRRFVSDDCEYIETDFAFLNGTNTIDFVEESKTPAEYYDLNGIHINGNPSAPGVYIKRQGTTSEKIVIK